MRDLGTPWKPLGELSPALSITSRVATPGPAEERVLGQQRYRRPGSRLRPARLPYVLAMVDAAAPAKQKGSEARTAPDEGRTALTAQPTPARP